MKNNIVGSMHKLEKIINDISKKTINKIAVDTKFTKRFSKLDGFTFFKAFTFGIYSLPAPSLRTISDFCEDKTFNAKIYNTL
ncbi:hypothetical protein D4Z93_04350 [Clostridium fermenticellae]|uniref:Uncharacterized protein n=1 Tax=Clostridium fermenticellae TaxID=2068654 RepID=A0A386H2J0_9CLOT|nr:hypothetical protein D4Z93_04350 [Clostridium fermenticellae]